jgi:hypothetical protein
MTGEILTFDLARRKERDLCLLQSLPRAPRALLELRMLLVSVWGVLRPAHAVGVRAVSRGIWAVKLTCISRARVCQHCVCQAPTSLVKSTHLLLQAEYQSLVHPLARVRARARACLCVHVCACTCCLAR